jgi:hypothetical protein
VQSREQRAARWAAVEEIGPNRRTLDEEHSLVFHRAETTDTQAGARVTAWLRNCTALEEGVQTVRGLSSPLAGDPAERHLGHWVRRQRRDADALCGYQRERLEALPALELEPRTAQWEQSLYDLADFVELRDRPPSHHAPDIHERRLGIWVRRQRRNALTSFQRHLIARALGLDNARAGS